MSRPTFLTINLKALAHNIARVRAFAPQSAIMAMVKANAYGHGIVQVAQGLSTADALGVASLEEGVKLREAGITQPIILMEGLFYPDEVAEADKHGFVLVVHHVPHIEMLEAARVKNPFKVWLKIDTGMHRLGIMPEQAADMHARLMAAGAVQKPIGIMTHFAEADLLSSEATKRQIDLFNLTTHHLSGPRSLANSAAILAWPETHLDWVRPGLMLYGASPFMDKTGQDDGLQPVMTLWSRLIAVKRVRKGEKIGYGGTWTAPEDMPIGVVGVGYGDGYPQFAENGTPVLVNDIKCQLVGRVSMDMLMVDLRQAPQAVVGDKVILWGDNLAVEQIARHSRTSAYEMLTRMTPRPKVEIAR